MMLQVTKNLQYLNKSEHHRSVRTCHHLLALYTARTPKCEHKVRTVSHHTSTSIVKRKKKKRFSRQIFLEEVTLHDNSFGINCIVDPIIIGFQRISN
jgi:hypothetical protein